MLTIPESIINILEKMFRKYTFNIIQNLRKKINVRETSSTNSLEYFYKMLNKC